MPVRDSLYHLASSTPDEAAERKRGILDSALDCIITTDRRGRIVDFNPAAERTFGYRREEVVGRRIGDTIVPPHLREAHERGLARFLESGEGSMLGRRVELTAMRADGSEFPVELAVTAGRLEGGERFATAHIRDITDRKRAETALRDSETLFRAAFYQAAVGMVQVGLDGRLRRVNDQYCRVTGYSQEELIGRSLWDLTYPEDVPETRRLFDETAAAERPSHTLEKRYVRKDGTPVWVRVTANTTRAEPDADAYVLGVVEDIDEEKRKARTRRFLLELNESTQPLTEPGEIMATAARMLGEHLEVNRCMYTEIESNGDHFGATGDYVRDTFSMAGRFSVSAFGERPPRLMRENKAYIVNDIEAETPAGSDLPAHRRAGIRALICVPLHKAGRLVASLAVHQKTPRWWLPEEIELVRLVAARCWEAIERARVERALRENEERLRLALGAAEMGVWELDFATDRITADARYRAIYGLGPDEEIVGPGHGLERVHPESREAVQAALEEACDPATEDRRYTLEYRVLPRDGTERWVLASGRVFFAGEGRERHPVRVIGTTLDITERKRLERQLRHSAFHDPLTDLPNRALFMDRLEHVVARTLRHGEGYALLMLDIDNFKLMNDGFGHLAGDRLLVGFARAIGRHLRPEDTLARLGGDEFCILIEEIDSKENVLRVVKRIQHVLKEQPFVVRGQEVRASVSIGITFERQHHRQAETALQDADVALYEAKRRGKNDYVVFENWMRHDSRSRLRLGRALQRAIADEAIVAEYQPIVDLATGDAVGCEALARWYHPQYGWVEPAQFIPLAEETGAVVPLGELVLETACRECSHWLREGHVRRDFYVSVNLAAQQLAQGGLVDRVIGLVGKYGLEGRNLRLEVTESSIIQNGEHAAQVIGELQAHGIRVCVDDFGVGYSSLSYLQRLPVSVLKLDQSFVHGLTEQSSTRAIVRSVLDLARNLGLEAIAEGAERAEHVEALKAIGFTRAQGFLFHRPMSNEAMADLAAAANQ